MKNLNKALLVVTTLFTQNLLAVSIISTGQVELAKVGSKVDLGSSLNFKLAQKVEVSEVEWKGYSQVSVCPGNEYTYGVDGEQECAVQTISTWVPEVRMKAKTAALLVMNSDLGSEVRSKLKNLDFTLHGASCINNFENYRVYSDVAPKTAPATLSLNTKDCVIHMEFNELFYFHHIPMLKNNSITASIYRTAKLKLNATENIQLSLNKAAPVNKSLSMSMQRRTDKDYPEFSIVGFVGATNSSFLFDKGDVRLNIVDSGN